MSLDEDTRSNLRAGLSYCAADLSSAERKAAMELLSAVGAQSSESVPLVLVCLTDKDSAVVTLAAGVADRLFPVDVDEPEVLNEAVRAVARFKDVPKLSTVAGNRLARMGPKAQAAAIDIAVAQLARVESSLSPLLAATPGDRNMVLQSLPPVVRAPFVTELDTLRSLFAINANDAQLYAIHLLNSDDPRLGVMAAEVIGTAPAQIDRIAILLGTIARGKIQSARVLNALRVDPKAACPHIASFLKSKEQEVLLAALHALKTIGVEGDKINPALAGLLHHPNDEILYAAAQLLGRQDILARAVIPSLIHDLRSHSPDRRIVAARQLDELKVEPDVITKALIRAVDRGDMPVRQGLIAAIDSAYTARKETVDMLKQAADQSSAGGSRAFARAALREIDLTKAQNEEKP